MKPGFNIIVLLALSFALLFGCAKIDRRADIVEEKDVVTERERHAEKARLGVLRTKQSLRIALLELNLEARPGQTVVLDSRVASLYKFENLNGQKSVGNPPEGLIQAREEKSFSREWSPEQLAVLHGKILPELYTFLNLLESKNIPLLILCYTPKDCDVLKANMGPRLKNLTKFAYTDFPLYLRRVIPLMTIAIKPDLFDMLSRELVAWESWKDNWFQVQKKSPLSPEQWSALLPSVNEF